MNDKEQINDEIDNYKDTIYAMVGFMNFYRYDDTSKAMKDNVLVFQGRRLEPSPEKTINSNGEKIPHVTPDIGVLLPSKDGVLGEVKKSFPIEQELWIKTFEQLMSYDDDLMGWPSTDKKVNSHDIVLILHQSRTKAVRKFFEEHKGSKINFNRPFCIIEFNRSDERKAYIFFRIEYGLLSDNSVNGKLGNGVQVPMDVFIEIYSTIKIYDSEPPLPYLIELIWTNVVLRKASEETKFEKLRKNQKIEVILEIDNIIEELHQEFSFRSLYGDNHDRQPKIPKKEWVMRACEHLVKSNEATWIDSTKATVKVFFRKYDDILVHFIELCSEKEENSNQLKLFGDKNNKGEYSPN